MSFSITNTIDTALQRLRPTFKKPTPPEYTTSFGIQLPVNELLDQNGSRRWIAIGEAAKVWRDSLQESIGNIIRENHQTIFDGLSVLPTISRCCWIIGCTKDYAHPTAVIMSSKKRVLKRIAGYVERSRILKEVNFRILIICTLFDVLYGVLQVSMYETADAEEGLAGVCGAKVYSKSSGRLATLGGVITLGGKMYGLTVAHVCMGEALPQPSERTKPRKLYFQDETILSHHDSITSSDDDSDDIVSGYGLEELSKRVSEIGKHENVTALYPHLRSELEAIRLREI